MEKIFGKVIEEVEEKLPFFDIPLFIGGQHVGGRVASMIAVNSKHAHKITGVIVLGYPFYPQGYPKRDANYIHFNKIKIPFLIIQGNRDRFGDVIAVRK